MTTEEKLKTYKEGFRDGFDEGYKRGRADADLLNPNINPYVHTYLEQGRAPHPAPMEDWTSCPICGRNGISGVVCSVPNCPTKATSIGVAGSFHINKTPVSGNGAAGV